LEPGLRPRITNPVIIYNVTVGVDKSIELEWLTWMRESHIPKVMATESFTGQRILKVLTHDDPQSSSYAIQYTATSMEKLQDYLARFAPALRKDIQDKFGDKQIAYRTILEVLS
jgi:hypothetical protein